MQALLALCRLHVVPVWPSRLVSLSSSSPLLLVYRCRPYLLCATCMWCLFGPPDWSVCHPVASSACLQVQALLALCRLHVVPVWPSRLVTLSSSSPLLLAYRCRPYLLCLPNWPVISRMRSTFSAAFLLRPTWTPAVCSTSVVCIIDYLCLLGIAHPPCVMDACTGSTLFVARLLALHHLPSLVQQGCLHCPVFSLYAA